MVTVFAVVIAFLSGVGIGAFLVLSGEEDTDLDNRINFD